MVSIDSIKDNLIEELWFPIIKQSGDIFYPRLKKNKKMKLLSLTNDSNFNEVIKIAENNLNRRGDEDNVLWTTSYHKQIRLETEAIGIVFSDTSYGDAIDNNSEGISAYFPRDILNLDFSFQKIDNFEMNLVEEISLIEKTIKLQQDNECKKFVLIYTTILEDGDMNKEDIITPLEINSEIFSTLSSTFSQDSEKHNFIKLILSQIGIKRGYKCDEFKMSCKSLSSREKILSIGGIFTKI